MHGKGQTVVFGKGGNRRFMQCPSPKAKISACAPRTIFCPSPLEKNGFSGIVEGHFFVTAVHDHHRGVLNRLGTPRSDPAPKSTV
jgi:hypothetical protein